MARVVRVKVRLDLNEAKIQARELGNILRSELNKATKSVNTDGLQQLRRSLQQVRREVRQSANAENVLSRSMGKRESAEQKLTQAQEKRRKAQALLTEESLTSVVRNRIANGVISLLAEGTQLLGRTLVETAQAAIEFESGMVRVAKTTEGVLDANHELTETGRAIRQEFLELSRVVPLALTELLKIGELGGQLGVARDDLTQFTKIVGSLSAATDLTVEQAATDFAKLQNVLGLTLDETEMLASAVVFLGNNYATTESKILAFSQRISGAAEVTGITEGAVVGIAAAFLSVGASSESAGTAVQKTFLTISQAVENGGAKLETLARTTGMTVEQFSTLWREDADAAFTAFVEGLGRQGSAAIKTLDELGIADQRLIRSFLALASAEGDVTREGGLLAESIEDAKSAIEENTALGDEAAQQFSTTEASIQKLKNAWNELQVALLDTQGIQDVVDSTTDFTVGLATLAESANSIDIIKTKIEELGGLRDPFEGFFGRGLTTGGGLEDVVSEADLERIARGRRQIVDGVPTDVSPIFDGKIVNQGTRELVAYSAALQLIENGSQPTVQAVENLSKVIVEQAVRLADGGEITNSVITQVIANLNELGPVTQSTNAQIAAATGLVEGNAQAVNSLAITQTGLIQATTGATDAQLGLGQATEETTTDVDAQIDAHERQKAALEATQKTVLEMTKGFIDQNTVVGQVTQRYLEQAVAAGVTTDELLGLVAATGQLTPAQQTQIENAVRLANEEARLNEEVITGNLTRAEAIVLLQQMAAGMDAAAESAAMFDERNRELSSTTADLVSGFLDTSTVTGQLTAALIDAAVQSGATALEIIDLAVASGQLSQAEAETAVKTLELAKKQAELKAQVEAGNITFAQAQAALIKYANALGLAADQAIRLTEVSSNFSGALDEVTASTGGAGGAAQESKKSFRDLFVEVINGAGDFTELNNTSEDWMNTLFDMSIAAGASIEQIIGLGLATGKLDDSLASTLLNMAVAQRGVEQIADAYVAGKINAEQASAAVKGLSEQIESGSKIDLTEFGLDPISASDLTEQASNVERATGGAGRAVETYRDKLLDLASANDITAATFAQLAQGTGNYSDEQIAAALVQDTVNRSLEEYADLIGRGLDPQKALDDIGNLKASLEELTLVDLTTFLDGIENLGVELNTEQFVQALEIFKETGEIVVPVALEVTEVDRSALDDLAASKIEVQAEITTGDARGGLEEGAGQLGTQDRVVKLTGDASDVSEKIREVVNEDQILDVGADTQQAQADIDEVIHKDYIIDVDADVNSSQIQAELNSGNYSIDVDVNFNDVTPPTPGGSSGGGSGSSPPEFGQGGRVPQYPAGGLLNGNSHANGGVLVEGEGGEFIVRKGAINTDTLRVLQSINDTGRVPSGVVSMLNQIASTQIPGGAFVDPLGTAASPLMNIPVPNNVNNTTSIDQSNTITNNNNYYGRQRFFSNRNDVVGQVPSRVFEKG